MDDLRALTAQVLASFDRQIVPNALEEHGKAQLTRVVAYLAHQHNDRLGLRRKTSGTQVERLAVDVVFDNSDGSGADIASSKPHGTEERTITAAYTVYPVNRDAAWLTQWVQPTRELAMLPGPLGLSSLLSEAEEPPPIEPPAPEPPKPPANDDELIVRILATIDDAVQRGVTEAVKPVLAAVASLKEMQKKGLVGSNRWLGTITLKPPEE